MRRPLAPIGLLVATLLTAGDARAEYVPPYTGTIAPWHLTPSLNLGFGLPTGMLGLSFEARYRRFALETGGGVGLGGAQFMLHGWAYLLPPTSTIDLELGAGYSTGPVASQGEAGGTFGPDVHYDQAHWVNIILAPGVRTEPDTTGPHLRLFLGVMINLAPQHDDHARQLVIFGLSLGWDFAL